MYLYATEGLGECESTSKWARVGSGTDPIGAEKELCPLLRDMMTGRYVDWTDYVVRTGSPKDRLSKFKTFRNEDCYRDYLERCRRFSPPPAPKPPRAPSRPLAPPPGSCWEKCRRKALECPGGRRSRECHRIFKECMTDCEGVMV